MHDNKLNYSVIIPHKDTPSLLQRCLDSIPRREDLEIIIVDDNSDSNIVDLNSFPGLSDPFVKVLLTKEGKGAGYARNIGLKEAKGKWLLFADADDFFNECLNNVLNKYKNMSSKMDLVLFKTNSVDSETLLSIKPRGDHYNQWIDKSLIENQIDERNLYKRTAPWGKFISRELVRKYDIRFDEVFAANDVMFSIKCAFYSQSIVIDSPVIYCATRCKSSIEKTITKEYQLSRVQVALNQYEFLDSIDKLEYRSNIWKNIFKSILVFNFKEIIKLIRKVNGTISMKYLFMDLFNFFFLIMKKLNNSLR